MQKHGSLKNLIFENWEHFQNDRKWPQCKDYSPCKIFKLGQKIKLCKTCEKRFYKRIKVVLWKKWLLKPANIRKMRAFSKWPKMVLMQRLWPLQITQFGSKDKIAKTCEKCFYKRIKLVLCKKRLWKTANIRKMRAF